MKRTRMAIFLVMASVLFLAACATTGPGTGATKTAILDIPECMT